MLDRDLIILAEKTLAGTAAKEDRPGAFGPRKRRLFSKMRPDEGNAASCTLPAKTQHAFRAIDFAVTRAQGALLIRLKRVHGRSGRHERLENFRKKAQQITRD